MIDTLSRRRLLALVPPGAIGGYLAAATGPPDRSDQPRVGCPEYGDDVIEVVCNEHERIGLTLDPSTTSLAAPGSITFTLRNRSRRTFETNEYGWSLHKHVDGEWFYVGKRLVRQPLHAIPPGLSTAWTLSIRTEFPEDGRRITDGSGDVEIDGLGGGVYAFGIDGWFEGDGYESKVALAETFELDAPSLSLEPSSAVSTVEWDGETLVARTDRGDPDGEYSRLAAFVLERVDDPDDEPERLIAEQVLARERLRDALALALEHGADRVRLEEYDSAVPPFARTNEDLVAFRDAYYRIETRELET